LGIWIDSWILFQDRILAIGYWWFAVYTMRCQLNFWLINVLCSLEFEFFLTHFFWKHNANCFLYGIDDELFWRESLIMGTLGTWGFMIKMSSINCFSFSQSNVTRLFSIHFFSRSLKKCFAPKNTLVKKSIAKYDQILL
jgi:hypothetical protein